MDKVLLEKGHLLLSTLAMLQKNISNIKDALHGTTLIYVNLDPEVVRLFAQQAIDILNNHIIDLEKEIEKL